MSITGFKRLEEVVSSMSGSFSFGNGALYDMCRNAESGNPLHLADLIWIIGRAYAASPERRTYGYKRDENGRVIVNEDDSRTPLATAISSADGKGDFFFEISETITSHTHFATFCDLVDGIKDQSFSFSEPIYTKNGSETIYSEDIKLLAGGVAAVYLFNYLIRRASEKFDGVTDDPNAWNEGARCKNQISFSSKFLHFHCPNIVYIIDQYSLKGGKIAVPSQKVKQVPMFKPGRRLDDVPLKLYKDTVPDYKKVNEGLNKEYLSLLPVGLAEEISNDSMSSKDEEKFKSYLDHVTRAYCTARYLHGRGADASPRKIDDLFLRLDKKDNVDAEAFAAFCQSDSTEF